MEKYGYKIYNKFDELPAWSKDSISKAITLGILKGTDKGLGLTLTEVKTLVWLDRCGLYNMPNPQNDDIIIDPEFKK